MSGITVTRRSGLLIAVKRADAGGGERLRHEADLLARLDHPGLVQFVAFVDGDPAELHMRYAGSESWLHAPPTSARGIVSGLAAVTATIADLHELGTAHGALLPEHVIIAADHRPVLCALGASAEADADTCGDDLLGLAGLIHHLATAAPDDLRRSLETIAGRVSTGGLSARELTDELNRLDTTRPRSRPTPFRTGHSPRTTAVAVAALLLLVLLGGWTLTRGSGPRASAGPAVVITPPASAPTTSDPTSPAGADPTVPLPDPTPTPAAPPDDVLVLVHDGRRYGVGREGDIALVGDWDCDGVATPALLQPADGLVALYATWPEPGVELEPAATRIVANATDLELDPLAGCDRLRVIQSTGSTLFAPEAP